MSRLVVVPLKEGTHDRARSLVEEGPPIALEKTQFDRHEVYLTSREAVFVFDGPDLDSTLEFLEDDPGVWQAAAAWSEVLAEDPRVAESAFSWTRTAPADGLSFEPTPGPGDSEGGELYTP